MLLSLWSRQWSCLVHQDRSTAGSSYTRKILTISSLWIFYLPEKEVWFNSCVNAPNLRWPERVIIILGIGRNGDTKQINSYLDRIKSCDSHVTYTYHVPTTTGSHGHASKSPNQQGTHWKNNWWQPWSLLRGQGLLDALCIMEYLKVQRNKMLT